MKVKKIAMFAVGIALCIGLHAQDKGTNTIIVKGIGFDQVKNSLLDNGYFIAQENNGTVTTMEKSGDAAKSFGQSLNRFMIVLSVRVKDSTAFITGQMRFTEDLTKEWHAIEYWKSKGSVPHHLFEIMDKFAQSLKGELSYAKN